MDRVRIRRGWRVPVADLSPPRVVTLREQPMSGVHTVLGAFTGVALAVVITILRVRLVSRFAGPSSPDRTTSPSLKNGRKHPPRRWMGRQREGGTTPSESRRARSRASRPPVPRFVRVDGPDTMIRHGERRARRTAPFPHPVEASC